MKDDVRPPEWQRPKPKRIEPIAKPEQAPLHEQAREVDASFLTPAETAAAELPALEATVVHHTPSGPGRKKWRPGLPTTKRARIITAAVVVLLVAGAGAGWTLTHHKRTVAAVAPHKSAVNKPYVAPVIYSTLTGLPVADASVNQRTVTGVMIENSLDARPQSGLGEAGVVFEAVAEGGVTRFLALFQDTAPANIGPVRSARPYYVSWDMGFDAAYAHVGGSPDGLADITAWGTHDMNQFYNGGSYHRITTRQSPHNVYTAISTLNQLEAAKGYTSTYTGFPRKTEQPYVAPAPATAAGAKTSQIKRPVDDRTPANSVDLALSGPDYNPHYDYVAATNSYNRSEGGAPHIDANTNKQISPKVVIAMVLPLVRGALDASGAYYSNYTTIGSGQAYIFQDGTVTTGQWAKPSNSAQLTFTDAAGKVIGLNPGTTWITAMSAANQVTYK